MTKNFWAPMPRLVGPVHATLPRGSVNGDSALQHDAKELEPPEHPQQIPLCWCIRHTHTVQCEWPNKLKELRKKNWVEAALKTSDHTESLLAFRITFMLIHTPLHSSLQPSRSKDLLCRALGIYVEQDLKSTKCLSVSNVLFGVLGPKRNVQETHGSCTF